MKRTKVWIAGCKEDRTGKEQAKRTCFKTCTDKYLWLLEGISTCCKHIYILQLDTMTQMTEAHGHDDPSMTVGDGGSGFVGNRPTRKKRKKRRAVMHDHVEWSFMRNARWNSSASLMLPQRANRQCWQLKRAFRGTRDLIQFWHTSARSSQAFGISVPNRKNVSYSNVAFSTRLTHLFNYEEKRKLTFKCLWIMNYLFVLIWHRFFF